MYSLTLLRHGESSGNAQKFLQGQCDTPLTETGVQQAEALACAWGKAGVTYDRIISSPLRRARKTAEIIAAALNLTIEFDDVWKERSFGDLEGMTLDQIHAIQPPVDFYNPYLRLGSAESILDLYLRASQGIQNLLIHHPEGRYLIVSHGAILNMAMYAVLGIAPQTANVGPRFPLDNTCYASLLYDPASRRWTVLGLNQAIIVQNVAPNDDGLA